jgi:hypothetical protein
VDKKTKKTYWIEGIEDCSFSSKEHETAGFGNYKCYFSYPKSHRFKITAFTVEFGKLLGEGFEPLVGRYEDVEGYAELISASTRKWTSSKMDFSRVTIVH